MEKMRNYRNNNDNKYTESNEQIKQLSEQQRTHSIWNVHSWNHYHNNMLTGFKQITGFHQQRSLDTTAGTQIRLKPTVRPPNFVEAMSDGNLEDDPVEMQDRNTESEQEV